MELNKIKYTDLNSRQKENYNYHKVASALADYGYDCMRLNNDWQGADFIAVHNDGKQMLKIQLKGRFTIDKKYQKKDIYIAFLEEGIVKMYKHDEVIDFLPDNIKNSVSWAERDGYSWGKTPKHYDTIIKII